MLLTRTQKEQLVAEMAQNLEQSKSVVLVNFQGLKVKEMQDLKKKLKEKGIGLQILKNTLFKIALKKSEIEIDEKLFDQPLAVIWGKDEVEPSKLIVEFAKTAESLKIAGGIVNYGFADEAMIRQLANLPSREELYAELVGSLNAPMSRLLNALQGNLRSLVYILNQYKNSRSS